MNNICIKYTGSYLPEQTIVNSNLAKRYEVSEEYIYKRTGIKQRKIATEKIEDVALKSVINLVEKSKIDVNTIDAIIVATTSTNCIMPGISNYIQKKLKINKCFCFDVLAGCAGYINAIDIARTYIAIGKINKCLVIGVDKLSDCIDKKDMGTSILFGDGAGAIILEKSKEENKYYSLIESEGKENEMLTYKTDEKIQMDGVKVYKYAISKTVENVNELLRQSNESIENISYIVPHQSNYKILKSIANRLDSNINKMYINIENIGNTFCASIPIALDEMKEKGLLKKKDKIILLGYGGGLNTGSILLEL